MWEQNTTFSTKWWPSVIFKHSMSEGGKSLLKRSKLFTLKLISFNKTTVLAKTAPARLYTDQRVASKEGQLLALPWGPSAFVTAKMNSDSTPRIHIHRPNIRKGVALTWSMTITHREIQCPSLENHILLHPGGLLSPLAPLHPTPLPIHWILISKETGSIFSFLRFGSVFRA